jgi:hypothetical protein
MSEDEYDILPRNSLEKLKSDLDTLKKKTSGEGSENMVKSMEELKGSINNLLEMFKQASEEMKLENAEQIGVEKKLGPLTKKVDMLIEQNQELAKGLVVVADMVKEHFPKLEHEVHDMLKKNVHKEHHPEPKHEEHHVPKHEAPEHHDFSPFGQAPMSRSPGQRPAPNSNLDPFASEQMPQQNHLPSGGMPGSAHPSSGRMPGLAPRGQMPGGMPPLRAEPHPADMPPVGADQHTNDLPPLNAPEPLGVKPKENPGFFGKLLGKK